MKENSCQNKSEGVAFYSPRRLQLNKLIVIALVFYGYGKLWTLNNKHDKLKEGGDFK